VINSLLKSALAIALMVAFTDLHAQIKSGYTIGLNLSTMTMSTSGKSFEPETMTGIHVGRIIEIPLKGNFSLKSGLLFSAKGSVYKTDTVEFSFSPVYIEVPVKIAFSIGSEVIKISLFTGPYFACGIGGNKESGGELEKIRFGSGENRDLRLFDIGLNFGSGVTIKGFMISAQYDLGLANISPAINVDSEMKSKVIGISITTLFAGK
jgi:hypothetical protein